MNGHLITFIMRPTLGGIKHVLKMDINDHINAHCSGSLTNILSLFPPFGNTETYTPSAHEYSQVPIIGYILGH